MINLTSEQVFAGNAFGKVLAVMPPIALPQGRGITRLIRTNLILPAGHVKMLLLA
ncbi:MAG: hypothetical protein AWT59_1039 [Candidatus Gallionella acididurans]|uniref:Uncharacterized protein n=1 Tax=Candidatus Gallionella acididurans TaxID=1796491 RepID=A0A139BUY1_9PROT|nr:MAG: hypothetical protein AWT59_1039 [Candidatus Gallionella acididurans]